MPANYFSRRLSRRQTLAVFTALMALGLCGEALPAAEPAAVRAAIQRGREERGLEPLPFDTGVEMLAESRRTSAGILARLKATLARSR